MVKSFVSVGFCILLGASAAHAATMVEFKGNSTGSLATGTATISLAADGSSIFGTLTNTSPFDAHITAFGFNIGLGNLNGFAGAPITDPGDVDFHFEDGALGNVAQYNGVALDFGYLTGKNFTGGFPNDGLDYFQTVSFLITGPFAGLSETAIATGLYVRFQRVGSNGNDSDVAGGIIGTPDITVVPEPGSMLLLGTGLAYLARRRLRRTEP